MTSGKRDPSETVPPARRRPAPTIDLKATEIASEPVKPSEPIEPAAEMTQSEPPQAAPEPPPQAASSPEPEPAPKSRKPEWLGASGFGERLAAMRGAARERFSWALAGAGIAGAAATLCVLLALWAFGAFSTRDDLAVTLAARLAIMELQMRDMASRPQPAGLDQRALADLAARVGAAEQAVGRLGGVEAGLAKLETAVAAPRPAATDQALAARVVALEATLRSLADLGPRVEAGNAAAREARNRADAALEAAQKSAARPAAPTADQGEIAALTARVAALEKSATAIEQRLSRPAANSGADTAGRLAFVAVALRAAAERGEPFAQELAAAKALMPDTAPLTPLEPFAATGVPRAAALARELSQITPAMLSAGGTPRDGGILDRLQANAEKLVRIRPINEAPGDDPATVVARADVKATHGDIAGALSELGRLPEATRGPAQAWIRKAEMQVAALAAARHLADSAVDALGKAAP